MNVTAEEFFKEVPKKPESFLKKKHLFTHLLTEQERDELSTTWKADGSLKTLISHCKKGELPFNVSSVQIINDTMEKEKHVRSLFDIEVPIVDLMAIFINRCLVREGKGLWCVRKKSDNYAFTKSAKDIWVFNTLSNSWYCISNIEKDMISEGHFIEEEVRLDVINPVHGFINIWQKLYDTHYSRCKLNEIILYYKSIKTIAEWES